MNLKGFFTKKRIIWSVIILLVVGYVGYRAMAGKNTAGNIQTDTVKRQNLEQTVLTTGQVVSSVDLELSFRSSGDVARVNVKEGDKVKSGTVLASLDQRDQLAALTQSQGALAAAQANYDKVLSGATSQDIEVSKAAVVAAQATLDNAIMAHTNTVATQERAVANALAQLVGLPAAAVADKDNYSTTTLSVSGTYAGTELGSYTIKLESGNSLTYSVYGLETVVGVSGSRTTPTPLGSRGLKLQFSSTGTLVGGETWTVEIPNTALSTYVSLSAAYQASLTTQKQTVDAALGAVISARAALQQAEASLALKQAAARPADVAAAQAQVLTAQGQVQAAQANVEDTIIRAPADGTITQVDVKVGEQASASSPVLVLQDVGSLHLEANVSEADIALVATGQSIDVTFDALSVNRHFAATVQTVNPASTVISGVVNYKVKAVLTDANSEIKPGMTANMTIQVARKENVLAIPQQAIINQEQKQYARVVDDAKRGTYHQTEVQIGISADGGLVEVTGGLTEGQVVVTYIKP